MSDTSQGQGWWLASDGKWYPPELWTGPPAAGPSVPAPDSSPDSASGPPAYPGQGQGYGAAGSPYATSGAHSGYGQYAPQSAGYGQVARRKTNGMAIASLICACAGVFLIGIPAVLGIIFGFVARAQIRQSNGTQGGASLALAGIIIGFAVAALIVVVLLVAATSNTTTNVVDGAALATALASTALVSTVLT